MITWEDTSNIKISMGAYYIFHQNVKAADGRMYAITHGPARCEMEQNMCDTLRCRIWDLIWSGVMQEGLAANANFMQCPILAQLPSPSLLLDNNSFRWFCSDTTDQICLDGTTWRRRTFSFFSFLTHNDRSPNNGATTRNGLTELPHQHFSSGAVVIT